MTCLTLCSPNCVSTLLVWKNLCQAKQLLLSDIMTICAVIDCCLEDELSVDSSRAEFTNATDEVICAEQRPRISEVWLPFQMQQIIMFSSTSITLNQ